MTSFAPRLFVGTATSLTALAAAALYVLGFFFIAQDAGTSGEELDGLGTAIGTAACVVALVPTVVVVAALWLRRRHLGGAALLLGSFGTVVAALGAVSFGAFGAGAGGLLLLGGGLVAALGFGGAAASRG